MRGMSAKRRGTDAPKETCRSPERSKKFSERIEGLDIGDGQAPFPHEGKWTSGISMNSQAVKTHF